MGIRRPSRFQYDLRRLRPGIELAQFAWYSENSGRRTRPVKTRQPNRLGLYDMSGNVWEWCWDWSNPYPIEAQVNPIGPESDSNRVLRGGSWFYGAEFCRVADRSYGSPGYRFVSHGFRLSRTL
ncbi:MAG: SUMF1/EgtB/PvdO family nonheme iron enzyme [Saprospiraceae bacterium]|nr:SUMF1/EgtB/PvdO family nonheme iron enzyme [Saprospiraceae bacterium]